MKRTKGIEGKVKRRIICQKWAKNKMWEKQKKELGLVRIHSIDLEASPKNTNYGSAGGKIVSEALRRPGHASASASAREYATHTSLIPLCTKGEKGKKIGRGARALKDDPIERPRSCALSSPRVQWARDRREKFRVLREGLEVDPPCM